MMSPFKRFNADSKDSPPQIKRLKFTEKSPPTASKVKTSHNNKRSLFIFKLKKFTLSKIVPLLASFGILILVLWQIEPPKTLTSASYPQFLLFFIPLTTFIYFILNLSPLNKKSKLLITGGLLILFLLKGMGKLNPLTFIIVILIFAVIFKLTQKGQKLNYHAKTPKPSHLSKQR